jgi:hypothetical protein
MASRMLIDQITPIYPNIMNKSMHMSSTSRQCWMQQLWQIQSMTVRTETGVRSLTTGRVPAGTQPVVSLHWRSVAKGMVGTVMICAMSSKAEMHVAESKISVENESARSRKNAMRGTMTIMALDQPH